jgi:hypothetical protein
MQAYAATHGGAVSARAARELGAGDGDIRVLMRQGLWLRPRRGVYVDPGHAGATPDPAHLHTAAAAIAACGDGTVVSHLSAVRLLGLPVPPGRLDDVVSLTRSARAHGNPPAGATIHNADVPAGDVTLVDGVPVVTGASLVLDCALVLAPPDALAVADAAVRRGLVSLETLVERRMERIGWPGSRRIGPVVDLVDPGAESWFESASRWWLVAAGLPRPELQHEFRAGARRARTDMWFERHRTVGEADGASKYDGPEGRRALVEEKLREDWLREEFGVQFVRWMPGDIATAPRRRQLVARFRAAFGRLAS